ncbi:MAG: Wzz/FepE/Etk N-terminal domain-containing protein, partial [Armatimonadota bacterium]
MEEIELRAFVRMIVQEKRLIIGVVAGVMLATAIVTFLVLPRQYTATATMLYNDTASASGASAIAATLGFSVGSTAGPAPWFEMILTSRALARKMVLKYNLVKILKADSELEAMEKFADAVIVTAKPEAKAFELSVVLPGTPIKYPGNQQDRERAKM